MSKWLETMMTAAAAVTAEQVRAVMPDNPVEKGDTVVGRIDMGLQRLLALANDFLVKAEDAQKAAEAADEAGNKELYGQHFREFATLQTQADVVFDMFWASVRSAFGLWSAPCVSLREDWQVVVTEERAKPQYRILTLGLGAIDLADLVAAARRH